MPESEMPKLQVIVGSTRPGRIAPLMADWFADRAREHGTFEVQLVDLLDVDLPFHDEPDLPRLG